MTAGALGSLTLSQCTVAGTGPGRRGRRRPTPGWSSGSSARSAPPSRSARPRPPWSVVDSTLDAGAGDAVRGAGLHLSLVGSTVVGAVLAHTLEASSAILDGRVVVENRQVGCVRYSYAPRGSRVPRRFRCSPSPTADRGHSPVLRRDRPRLALVPRARPGLSRRDRRGRRGRRRDGRAPPPRPPAAGARDDAGCWRRTCPSGSRSGFAHRSPSGGADMHGDFSRRTFDPADGYRAVLLQQGRVLLDAELERAGRHHRPPRRGAHPRRRRAQRRPGPRDRGARAVRRRRAEQRPGHAVGVSATSRGRRCTSPAALLRRRRARREPRRRRRPGGRWATSRTCRSSPPPGPSTRHCRNRTTTAATRSSSTSGSGR